MKRLKTLFAALCCLLCAAVSAQTGNSKLPDGTYYIVRHAEKDTVRRDPALIPVGYIRSGDLYRVLKDKKISKIFVNQYRRIQLTADSLRIYGGIDTFHYVADATCEGLINRLSETLNEPGVNILIIGHSNTVPEIIRRLGVNDYAVKELADYEYDNLFIVTIKDHKASLRQLKFGKRSAPAEKPAVMKPL